MKYQPTRNENPRHWARNHRAGGLSRRGALFLCAFSIDYRSFNAPIIPGPISGNWLDRASPTLAQTRDCEGSCSDQVAVLPNRAGPYRGQNRA